MILFEGGKIEAVRIETDAVIEFEGPGEARFRLQHTKDFNGGPDDLLWSDVSLMSDASLPLIEKKEDLARFDPFGVLVDRVHGYRRVVYRRHSAEWIRVVPFDVADASNLEACAKFTVTCSGKPGRAFYGNPD